MPQAKLKVKTNDALVALSERHPEVGFDVLGAWPLDEKLRVLIKTTQMELPALEETLSDIPKISDTVIRHATEQFILFELNTPSPVPHGAMAESEIVPQFPLHLEGGWFVGNLTANQDQLSSFREELENGRIEYQLMQVSAVDDVQERLTDRQKEVVGLAVERGYYDSPRRCTLSNLAELLGVNKSVVSRVLHRAEGKIITAYWSS